MGIKDKELIEKKYGRLWSGSKTVIFGGKHVGIKDALKAIDLLAGDIVPIDLVKLGKSRFALRYYDDIDRCVVALEMDTGFRILQEHRAHIGEWLEDTYHDLDKKSISPDELLSHLMDLYEIPDR